VVGDRCRCDPQFKTGSLNRTSAQVPNESHSQAVCLLVQPVSTRSEETAEQSARSKFLQPDAPALGCDGHASIARPIASRASTAECGITRGENADVLVRPRGNPQTAGLGTEVVGGAAEFPHAVVSCLGGRSCRPHSALGRSLSGWLLPVPLIRPSGPPSPLGEKGREDGDREAPDFIPGPRGGGVCFCPGTSPRRSGGWKKKPCALPGLKPSPPGEKVPRMGG
jgi:hypothetical protein